MNGVVHIANAIAFRHYNPGLYTGVAIFLPVGGYAVMRFHALGDGGAIWQAVGLLAAIALHVAIVVHVLKRRATLPAI